LDNAPLFRYQTYRTRGVDFIWWEGILLDISYDLWRWSSTFEIFLVGFSFIYAIRNAADD